MTKVDITITLDDGKKVTCDFEFDEKLKVIKQKPKIIQSNPFKTDSCTEKEFSSIKQAVLGLDDGELEAICIVNKCNDRKFKKYLILTDDRPAQKRASHLGMNSLDVVSFLFLANQKGVLDRHNALQAINTLGQNNYFIEREAQRDFEIRLR